MRVTFPRLHDHERGYAVVERDDGVVYRLYGDMAGPRLPHDIRHLIVERELGITDGIWGGIAAGAVFGSMRHVSGRRRPRAAARSRALVRNFADQELRVELIAVLVESVAALHDPSPDQIRRLARAKLAMLPDADTDPVAIAAAASALQVEAARWARLRVGQELVYDWPTPQARGTGRGRPAAWSLWASRRYRLVLFAREPRPKPGNTARVTSAPAADT
jgi:hypothetical protein